MLLPTTKDSTQLVKAAKSHDEINTYSHLIRHLSTDKDARKLTILLIINLICAVLEVVYGLLSNSIGLLSDSAHMLFDSTALAVGIYASYKATLPANSKFSYGFDRFQTLSGLINGIFLIFIGFYIFIESLERIYNPPVIHSSKMIVVAVIGLIVNVVGVTFFHEHAHFGDDHGGCSHGHGHSHSHKEEKKQVKSHQHNHSHAHHAHSDSADHVESTASIDSTVSSIKEEDVHSHHAHAGCNHGHNSQQPDHHHQHHCSHEKKDHHNHSHSHSHHSHSHAHEHKHELVHAHEEHDHHHHHDHDHDHDHSHDDHGHHHHHNENLYGVFLHILADLLGSVGVITSSILIMLFDWYIADAICSAITSLLILASVVPLIKSSIMVFLQTYPERYKKNFHQALMDISQHPSVIEFKEPHLWMYTQSKLVCSVILVVKQNTTDTNSVIEFARKKLKTIKSIEYMTIDCRVEGQN